MKIQQRLAQLAAGAVETGWGDPPEEDNEGESHMSEPPEAGKNLAPQSPRFSAASAPGWRCNWVQSKPTRDRQEPARPRTPRAYLNFPST